MVMVLLSISNIYLQTARPLEFVYLRRFPQQFVFVIEFFLQAFHLNFQLNVLQEKNQTGQKWILFITSQDICEAITSTNVHLAS